MNKLLFIFLLFSYSAIASIGDTSRVFPFKKVFIKTDPSKGFNKYAQWGNFSPLTTPQRKVLLNVTFQCPDSLHCGEWDYTGNISIKKTGGVNEKDKNWEIALNIVMEE